MQSDLAEQKKITDAETKSKTEALQNAEKSRGELDAQIKKLEEAKATDTKRISELQEQVESLDHQVTDIANHESEGNAKATGTIPTPETPAAGTATGAAKKKNKKKKKGGAAAVASKDTPDDTVENSPTSVPPTLRMDDLESEISRLKGEVADRDAQIAKLQTKRKTEEDLREELEHMQENLINIGQEHVEG